MIVDQLHIPIDRNECIRESLVQNGYFYILLYNGQTQASHNQGFDRSPLIYCMAPDIRNINNFWGINFHYFNKTQQEYILEQLIKKYNILEHDNKRVLLSNTQLHDVYSSIGIGVRCYSRKGVQDIYRIKNRYIPKYLEVSPNFFIRSGLRVASDNSLSNGNKGF